MITLYIEDFNSISAEFYNDLISNLQFHQLTCTCGHSSCLHVHGYYKRSVKTNEEKVKLRICRVKCDICGCTHALLPSSIVPYSQISLLDQVTIIDAYEAEGATAPKLEHLDSVDSSNYRYVIKQYLCHWKQRLLSERISLSSEFSLIKDCFAHFFRQFMQIHCTSNKLFLNTT